MYEFTISTINHQEYCNQIYSTISKKLDKSKSIVACHKIGNICYVSFAVEQNVDWAKGIVAEMVADIVARNYKKEYFLKAIKKVADQLQYDKLICALVAFDILEDKRIVKESIDFDNKINIDSFYQFKLGDLKDRWRCIADIFIENIYGFLSGGVIDDLTKQFVKSTTAIVDLIDVFVEDKKIVVQSELCNLIFQKTEKDTSNLVCELISLSPNKIVIHEKNGDEISNMLYLVFGNKIYKTM